MRGTRTEDFGAVMMGGANCSIADAALALFTGKTVTLVPHLDKAGLMGAAKWKAQLEANGARAHIFDLSPHLPEGRKDLNDALRATPDLNLFCYTHA